MVAARFRTFVLAGSVAALGLAAAPASAGPCQEDPCPRCYTEKADAIWQEHTGKGPLFMCPM